MSATKNQFSVPGGAPKKRFPAFRTAYAMKLLSLLLLSALPAVVQAQFTLATNNAMITIVAYTGPGGAVTIPSKTNGYPVTSIGAWAFEFCTSLTNVTIPSSITSIGEDAFVCCTSLASIAIPDDRHLRVAERTGLLAKSPPPIARALKLSSPPKQPPAIYLIFL